MEEKFNWFFSISWPARTERNVLRRNRHDSRLQGHELLDQARIPWVRFAFCLANQTISHNASWFPQRSTPWILCSPPSSNNASTGVAVASISPESNLPAAAQPAVSLLSPWTGFLTPTHKNGIFFCDFALKLCNFLQFFCCFFVIFCLSLVSRVSVFFQNFRFFVLPCATVFYLVLLNLSYLALLFFTCRSLKPSQLIYWCVLFSLKKGQFCVAGKSNRTSCWSNMLNAPCSGAPKNSNATKMKQKIQLGAEALRGWVPRYHDV